MGSENVIDGSSQTGPRALEFVSVYYLSFAGFIIHCFRGFHSSLGHLKIFLHRL